MAKQLEPRNLRGRMILLGVGTSVGVPTLGCDCPVCTGGHPRNQRTRCAALFGLPEGNLLIDTPPDLRLQLLRERVRLVHAVAFTHAHADHLFGLDDLRLFPFQLGRPVPVYCRREVEARIRRCFDYAFSELEPTHVGAAPQLDLRRIDRRPFRALGAEIIPIPLRHGPRCRVVGFRIGRVAYCTDTNGIPAESWPLLEGLDLLVLDALRRRPHATHFGLDQAIAAARRIGARRTLFTHLSHDLDYDAVSAELPPGMELAYDGLEAPLT